MEPTQAHPIAATASRRFLGARAPAALRLVGLLLAGCAAAPSADETVLLTSETYTCGAEEGLGCGLALAPVLARLDRLEGVAGSWVAWDGRTIRLDLLPGADAERVAAAAGEVLQGSERRISLAEAELPRGGHAGWWNAAGTADLSRHEAGVLAERFADEMARELDLAPQDRRQLSDLLRAELEQAFEAAHAAGGGLERLREQMALRRADFEGRLDFLTEAQRAELSAFLDRELGG